jgi:acetyltransferase
MLAVCRQLGFTVKPDKEDGAVMKVALELVCA